MAFDDSDRRRTSVLMILTIIALPAVYFFTKAEDASTAVDDTAVVAEDGPNRPPLEVSDQLPSFLDSPTVELDPGIAEVAVPARPDTEPIRLSASYRSTVPGGRTCIVKGIAGGLTVTVKNLDNGRTITCVTQRAPVEQSDELLLFTDTFARLADLTEAPITVELTQ